MDRSESAIEHTLLIVEEDVLDSPETYQVTKLEHPPDSGQVKFVKTAMMELRQEATEKTGTPHRLVTESGDPETIETHYAMHARAAEKAAEGDLVTDGGVDQSEAEDDQIWPDDLNVGDSIEYDGNTYEVVGTGPGEASLERVDDDTVTAVVFRWAFTNTVGIEIEDGIEQEQFKKMVSRGGD